MLQQLFIDGSVSFVPFFAFIQSGLCTMWFSLHWWDEVKIYANKLQSFDIRIDEVQHSESLCITLINHSYLTSTYSNYLSLSHSKWGWRWKKRWEGELQEKGERNAREEKKRRAGSCLCDSCKNSFVPESWIHLGALDASKQRCSKQLACDRAVPAALALGSPGYSEEAVCCQSHSTRVFMATADRL